MRDEEPDSTSFSGGGEGERLLSKEGEMALSKGETALGGGSTTLHPGTSMSGDFETGVGIGGVSFTS